jgi:hypothetical protein
MNRRKLCSTRLLLNRCVVKRAKLDTILAILALYELRPKSWTQCQTVWEKQIML